MVIGNVARRSVTKSKNSIIFGSELKEWTVEDVLCIGY